MLGRTNTGGGGGGGGLNFKVVPNPQPSNPKENTIWVNTDTEIPGWHFGAEEPNVYNLALHREADWHTVAAPHELSAGEILNFTIPKSVPHTFEALAITDNTGKVYYVRAGDKTALKAWEVGTKIGVIISNDVNPIGAYVGHGTAYLMAWDSYYHQEGTVWIQTGTSSPVAFNALKKNSVMVYPLSAKQYISGAWVDKEAKSYQNGEWVGWIAYLYNKGDDCTGVTGGWSAIKIAQGGGGFEKTGTCAVNDDSFTLTANSAGTSISRVTNNMIDLTKVSAIYMAVSNYTGSSALFLSCGKQKNFDTEVAKAEQKSTGAIVLDVSGLTGSYYISATLSCYAEQSGSTAKITQIWYK